MALSTTFSLRLLEIQPTNFFSRVSHIFIYWFGSPNEFNIFFLQIGDVSKYLYDFWPHKT